MLYILIVFLAIAIVVLSMGLFYSLIEAEDLVLSLLFGIGIILAFCMFTLACFTESKSESEQRILDNVANGVKYEKVNGKWKESKPEEPEEVKTIN